MLIDIHVHVQLPRTRSLPDATRYPYPEEMIATLDACGVDRAVVMARVSPECARVLVEPAEVLAICRRFQDRFIPFANLDPRMIGNSPETDFSELLALYKSWGCRGIGEYLPNLPFDDPLQMNVFRQVSEARLPLLFHIGPTRGGCYGCYDEPGLPRLERVLRAFPDLILIGHSQPFWSEISADVTPETRGGYPSGKVTPGRVVDLMRRYPNLYGDLSAGSGHNAVSRDPDFGLMFLEEFQDRLLFGTDICRTEQAIPLPDYFRSLRDEKRLAPAAWEKIAWRNADRLLNLGLSERMTPGGDHD